MSYTQRMQELIHAYIDKFGVGPPIWLVPEDEAVRLIEEALKSGEEIRDEDVTDPDLPPDALTDGGWGRGFDWSITHLTWAGRFTMVLSYK